MDKKSLIAIAIVTIVILLLPSYYELIYDQPVVQKPAESTPSYEEKTITQVPEKQIEKKPEIPASEPIQPDKEVPFFQVEDESILQAEQVTETSIETPLISARLSNLGGGKFLHWNLKEYDTWTGERARIINESYQNGIDISFITTSGEKINLNNYRFHLVNNIPAQIDLEQGESFTFQYQLEIQGSIIKKDLTIFGSDYHVDLKFELMGAKQLLLNDEYEIIWLNGLPSNEKNVSEEYTYSEAYASMGGELEDFNIDSEERVRPQQMNGKTDWIATRTKYFLSAIIPIQSNTVGAVFAGEGVKVNDVIEKRYNTSMICSVDDRDIEDIYQIYMGPLDYTVLTDYENGMDELIMNHGWYERTFRPISLLILKVFKFFQLFIPNYGIVIILFSILVKVLVYPLTKKSYQSMKEMGRIQPLVAELREKYKGDPQRLNKETMKLYKEHGVNPMGGCLPMLLQLPLLGALFIVFRSTIQLRGASFIPGWIDDLSTGDTIFTLPFSLPLYGDQFNILPILMAVTMIFQSKMTMQDPKQKAMVYLMPVFMLLIFNQFPSGLNLYYTMFNVLTIIQQKLIDGPPKSIKNK